MTADHPTIDEVVRFAQYLGRGLFIVDQDFIHAAAQLAYKLHWGRHRRHGAAYITHPLEVARLARDEFGIESGSELAAALLHDVFMERDPWDLTKVVGRRADQLVRVLTMPNDAAQRHLYWRLIMAIPEAMILKTCDRLADLGDALRVNDRDLWLSSAYETRRDLLFPGSPVIAHPKAGPRLEAAVVRCEEVGRR